MLTLSFLNFHYLRAITLIKVYIYLRNLNDLKIRQQCQIKISNRFAALGNLSYCKDRNRAWENIEGNIKTLAKESLGLYELKHHKP